MRLTREKAKQLAELLGDWDILTDRLKKQVEQNGLGISLDLELEVLKGLEEELREVYDIELI